MLVQQRAVQCPVPQRRDALRMRRCQQRDAAAGGDADGFNVLRRADLVKGQHVRPHGAQEHHAAGRLLSAGHHVRIRPDVKLRRAVLHGRDLAALVHERDARAQIGQAAHAFAQQRRLPVSGRREDERAAKPILEQLRQKRIGAAGHRVRNPHGHGAQLPDTIDLPGGLSVGAAAKPDSAAAGRL